MPVRLRRIAAALVLLALCCCLSGCGERDDLMEVRVAYCAAHPAGTEALTFVTRRVAVTEGDRLCSLVLQLAMTEPEDESLTCVFPRRTAVRSVEISDQGIVTVDFSENYSELTGMDRTLADDCVVETLFALGSVNGTEIRGVRITVEGKGDRSALTTAAFVDSGDYLRLREYSLSVYFPNRTLGTLEEDVFQRTLSARERPADTVVSLLLSGRRSSGRIVPLVSKDTVFLGLEIRSQVCYLNFNEAFLDTSTLNIGDSPLRLYAFVNSLCALPEIERVQFLINGEVVTAPQYENFDLPYAPL